MCVMMFTNIDRVVEDFHDPNVGISTVKLYIYIYTHYIQLQANRYVQHTIMTRSVWELLMESARYLEFLLGQNDARFASSTWEI